MCWCSAQQSFNVPILACDLCCRLQFMNDRNHEDIDAKMKSEVAPATSCNLADSCELPAWHV